MSTRREEFTKIMVYLASLYPRFELTEATLAAYRDILQDVDPRLLKAAAREIGAESVFFPAAAELRKAARRIYEQWLNERWKLVHSTTDVDAQVAFMEVYGTFLLGRRNVFPPLPAERPVLGGEE